jgi:DNA-binding ferritin-like protein
MRSLKTSNGPPNVFRAPKAEQKQTMSTSEMMGAFVFELMNGRTKTHIAHLAVSGPGAYATHMALNGFYDEVGAFIDSLAEQYQGVTEKLLVYPNSVEIPTMKTAAEGVEYLRTLYSMCEEVQEYCGYSEIINTIDEIKSLINSTKYKLIFLQ